MAKHDEMTRHAFISHMEDYMKKLLTEPLKADTDEFLKGHGIDGPKALKILTMRSNPDDENSSIVVKSASIKDNGYDEDGKRNKDSFVVKYKIPRKDYTKKMRNLFISLFERNMVDNPMLEEGAWGYGVLDNDEALDYQSQGVKAIIAKMVNDINNANDADRLWSVVGVLYDFLKKYKNDEIQVTDEYTNAIKTCIDALNRLAKDQKFITSWDSESKIKASIKKTTEDLIAMRYNEEIMNSGGEIGLNPMPTIAPQQPLMEDVNYYERPLSSTPSPFKSGEKVVSLCKPGSIGDRWAKYVNDNEKKHTPKVVNEEGEGAMDGVAGATNAESSGQFTTPLFGKPVRRKSLYITQEQADFIGKMINEEEGMAGMGGATTTQTTGDYQYTVPLGSGKKKKDSFYGEAMDHKDMMKKSWQGSVDEEIKIKEKNKGKFNATKARTGKSTEELTHSKNPVTRKRAIFAQNAAKWNKK